MRGKNYIDAMKEGDLDSLNHVIDLYSNLAFKVSYKVLQNRELSNECVNETFFKVWSNVKKFNRDEKSFKNWICTIAKYTAIDILRKEKKHDENIYIEDILIDISDKEDDIETSIVLKEAIQELDELDRTIFIRRFYNEEKICDIARDLSMTDNAVYLRIMRGKKALANKLKESK
ncbi:MAG: sigma-70 family RNA polymerase sigma factor [Sarcina sp.]